MKINKQGIKMQKIHYNQQQVILGFKENTTKFISWIIKSLFHFLR